MKRIRFLIFIASVSLLPAQNLFPILGGQRSGTSIFSFLKIGVSARAVGMGEAVVALRQDAGSMYYNPATIAQFEQSQLSTSRIQWPADINYDFAGFSTRISGNHFIGISGGILHMEPMMETTEYLPHGTGNYFVFQDKFIGLSYGVKMTDRFSFGLTLKHVNENLAGHQMNSSMIDLGTFYWTGFKSLRFSAALSNFGGQARPEGTYKKRIIDKNTGEETVIDSEFEQFSPPTVFRVGIAMELMSTETQRLTGSFQLNHPVDNAENVVMGFEYLLYKSLALRAGYKINNEEEDLSFGAGFYVPIGPVSLRIDYAFTNFKHLSDPHRISLNIGF